MSEQFVTYFGYGSLVNRNTRPAAEQALPARLYGWRRVWGHRVHASGKILPDSRGSCCSLSVEKCVEKCVDKSLEKRVGENHQKSNSNHYSTIDSLNRPLTATKAQGREFIDGVVVTIPLADLPALDEREDGYDRVRLPADDFDLPAGCAAEHIHIYVSDATHSGRSNIQYPILQSYIDCVLAGYCAVFEQAGMQHFVESTVGWDGVIEDERLNPRYPRAVQLSDSQLALFDRVVNNHRST